MRSFPCPARPWPRSLLTRRRPPRSRTRTRTGARPGPEREKDGKPEGLAAILDVVGRALEPVYGFRSLATFKSRFKPDYRTLYLYYQDPLQLPAIGRALSRAYLPGLSVRQSARLLRTLVS